ncbi:murein biosynthesis integral membrane protein MurJ [Rossellomorea marisflavi]|uniref:murein biosynthesis integral membrane protein MurJ n=1 Tax=Rossellomorea marisflavi TaxID=189381 RepID=UPI003457D1D4
MKTNSNQSIKIFKFIGLVTLLTIITKVVGFIREILIGINLGTNNEADFIILTLTIPTFIYLIIGGAFTTSFISIYLKLDEQAKARFLSVVNRVINVFSFTVIVALVLGYYLVPYLRSQNFTVYITAIPSIYFYIKSSFFSGILNANKKFIKSATAILLNNVLFIIILIILQIFTTSLATYAIAFLISSIIMYWYLYAEVRVEIEFQKFQFKENIFKEETTKRFLKLSLPIVLGGASTQLYALMQRLYAIKLDEGYIAAVNYASKLVLLPQGIILTGITTVIFPYLAKMVSDKDISKLKSSYVKGEKLLFYILGILSINIIVFSKEIVSLIFEYGSFDSTSTYKTALMLKFMVIGMYFSTIAAFITRYYYAYEKNNYPVIVGFFSVFVMNPLLFGILEPHVKEVSLPLSTSLSLIVQFILLKFKLKNFTGVEFIKAKVLIPRVIFISIYFISIQYMYIFLSNYTESYVLFISATLQFIFILPLVFLLKKMKILKF